MKEKQFNWIRAVLATTAPRWLNLVNSVPDELLRQQPAPGEWSALECLGHLLDTERQVFPVRTRQFLAGQDLSNFDPDRQGTKITATDAASDLAQTFADLRRESMPLLDGLESPDLGRQVSHSVLGAVTLGELLNEWAAHDLMHTVQAERALMQPFIQHSGPWKPFFADHDLQAILE